MGAFFGELERLVADLYPYRWLIIAVILVALAAVAAFGYRKGWHTVVWEKRVAVAMVATPMLILGVIAGWYLGSPLFIDKRVEEEFPFALNAVVPSGLDREDVEMVMAGIAKTELEFSEPMSDMTKATRLDTATINDGVAMIKQGMVDSDDAMVDKGVAMIQEVTEPAADATETSQALAVKLKAGEFRDADRVHKGSGQAALYQGPDGAHLLRLENLNVTNGPDLHVILSPHPDPKSQGDIKGPGYVDLGKLKGNQGNQNYEIPDDVDIGAQQSVVVYCKPFHVIFSVASLQDVS